MTESTGRPLREALRDVPGLDDAFEADVAGATALLTEPRLDADADADA